MDLDRFNKLLLQSVGVGLAVFDRKSLDLVFLNDRMDHWFSEQTGGARTLEGFFPQLDREKMEKRLEAGRAFTFASEVQRGTRKISLAVEITLRETDSLSVLMLECQNITKIRELEYMIQSYSSMIEKQNRDLRKEKERVEKVLLNIMPKTVYEEWRQFGVTTPQRFEDCSLLMLDFVGFTEMAITEDPPALISELNDIFTAFDRIVEQFGCERLKTIGDAYIAVSGIPEATPDHANNIAGVALRIVHFLRRRNETHSQKWACRIGINSGPVIGSIVGIQKYVYDVFGPGINLAARLETQADSMEIILAEEMRQKLTDGFIFEEIGERELRGFGKKRLYRLLGSDEIRVHESDRKHW
ncbi:MULTISPECIES: adenylate/guanylate cyclase domain-containing protein [Limibacillus]|jgi:class 3 adenylate cyclase|uniref:Class 3 adenylate cyclase n=1 Tax=Limibacillus halophilus TaxID=1579333 RepID=A0A839SQ19_9PROT|nr:adenylate/guanylate cyclase domain-containing protein [Limibacillus halophilus]MBB3064552.1 class 3 adenylate cyclase [Limibacillus halophilus]